MLSSGGVNMRQLTSKTLSRALTYIFLRPSEVPTAASATISPARTKTGVKNKVSITRGDENDS